MPSRSVGLIPIDKPPGVTSRHVVDVVSRAAAAATAGHAGTLDPISSGVVVVCLGRATKLVEFLHGLPKSYRGSFLLGRSSPSDDIEQPVELEADPRRPGLAEIDAALGGFRGEILQRPCDFSAVRVAGRRAYELARRGREMTLEPKRVTIHRLELVRYDWPRLVLDVTCSSGTYIRGLGRDLAVACGTRAVMEALVRTAVGPFSREASLPLDEVTPETVAAAIEPPLAAVAHLPRVVVDAAAAEAVATCGMLPATAVSGVDFEAEAVAAVDTEGRLAGVLRPHAGGWRMRPNFLAT